MELAFRTLIPQNLSGKTGTPPLCGSHSGSPASGNSILNKLSVACVHSTTSLGVRVNVILVGLRGKSGYPLLPAASAHRQAGESALLKSKPIQSPRYVCPR